MFFLSPDHQQGDGSSRSVVERLQVEAARRRSVHVRSGVGALCLMRVTLDASLCDELERQSDLWTTVHLDRVEATVSDDPHAEDAVARALAIFVQHGRTTELWLTKMSLGMALSAWQALGQGLMILAPNINRLTRLRITTTEISSRAMAALADGLRETTALETLDLNYTTWINDDENDNPQYADRLVAVELARGLVSNASLRDVQLAGCSLSDDSLAVIIKALQFHSTLSLLDMSGNHAGTNTSRHLYESTRLVSLNLSRNHSTRRRGANDRMNFDVVADALRHNTALHSLDISDNHLTDEELRVLGNALACPSTDAIIATTTATATTNDNEHNPHMTRTVPTNNSNTTTVNMTLRTLNVSRNALTGAGLATWWNDILPHLRGLKTLNLLANPFQVEQQLLCLRQRHGVTATWQRHVMNVHHNQTLQTLLQWQDVALLKAFCAPEQFASGLWPRLLERLQAIARYHDGVHNNTTATEQQLQPEADGIPRAQVPAVDATTTASVLGSNKSSSCLTVLYAMVRGPVLFTLK